MQHANSSSGSPQAFQQISICEGAPELTDSPGDGSAGKEGGTQTSEDDPSGGHGLLGKLQRNFSFSLSRISSIVPGPNTSRRRKSSVGVDSIAAVVEGAEEGPAAEAGSPALDALMPFVPLMFRRDLLLPEPTFSAIQVKCAFIFVFLQYMMHNRVRLPKCARMPVRPELYTKAFARET